MTNNEAMTHSNTIGINYSDAQLRVLVEECITQLHSTFTLKGVCSYVFYWAMEEGQTTNIGLYESTQLAPADCERVRCVLEQIVREGRIVIDEEQYKKLTN